jgi:hypothetical protein
MSQYQRESVPNTQPAACSLTGIVEDEWYVRLFTKDAKRGSILLSAKIFDEIARNLGYSLDPHTDLRNKISDLAPCLDSLVGELAYNRVYFANVENLASLSKQLEQRVTELSGLVAGSPTVTAKPSAKPSKPLI